MSLWFALVKVKVFYGTSIALPLASTSTPVYPLPPQTTVLGALAYPYLRLKELRGEIKPVEDLKQYVKDLLDKVVYVAAGTEGYVSIRTLEQIYQEVYLRKQHRGKGMEFSVGVKGLTTYVDNVLLLLYVSRDPDILRYAYGISRVGRKEDIVAVEDVIIDRLEGYIESSRFATVITSFYVPRRLVESCSNAKKLSMPILDITNFSTTVEPLTQEFYVPSGLGPMMCTIGRQGALLKVSNLEIIIPRELLSGSL